jgi:ornithine cyclodeaminase/alanine dehydrogenase-like protein (mu-crystallin family)
MIYLNQNDILAAVSAEEMIDAIESALKLYENKDFHMPQRFHLDHGPNTVLLMPCFTKDYFCTKLISLFPGNPKKNLSVLNGIVVLNDAQTGLPLALLDGPTVTAFRTAAVSAVSIRHLAPEKSTSLGIIGAGEQAFYQVWLASQVKSLTEIWIYDINPSQSSNLTSKLIHRLPEAKICQAETIGQLLEQSQVVITATTSDEPVLPKEVELLAGKHYACIGSYKPHARELPQAIYGLIDQITIDAEEAIEESGDIIIPLDKQWIRKDQIITLGRYLLDNGKRKDRAETTVFKSVGIALFDLCAAKLIYEKAVKKDFGQKIER